MRRFVTRKTTSIAGAIAGLLSFVIYNWTPLPAIWSVGTLSDPSKLATLGPRGANPRLNKIVYWLDEGSRKGSALETTIDWAQRFNGVTEPRKALVRESLLHNYQIATDLGLLTDSNRERLRRGQEAVVTRGEYKGDPVEIDHIVPYSVAPEVGNELANLEMLAKTLNRQKSDRVGPVQMKHAERLLKAGLLRQESYEKLRLQEKQRPWKK
jgi:hypothetical protein